MAAGGREEERNKEEKDTCKLTEIGRQRENTEGQKNAMYKGYKR
jgi:hypothetical protein